MSQHKRLRELRDRLDRFGIDVVRATRRRRHILVRIAADRRYATLVMSSTPSDWRSLANTLAQAKRLVRPCS